MATDRPHVFNAYGAYIYGWNGKNTNETTLSFFQAIQSGTPITSTVGVYTTSIFLSRGDLGRTPVLTQTDLSFSHKYRFGRDNKFAMAFDVNLINAWDQKTVVGYNTSVSAVTLTEASLTSAAAFPGVTNSLDCPVPIAGAINPATGLAYPAVTCPRLYQTPAAFTNAYTAGQLATLINRYLDGTPGQATIPGMPGYFIPAALNRRNSAYNLPNAYQAPLGVRFGFRFLF